MLRALLSDSDNNDRAICHRVGAVPDPGYRRGGMGAGTAPTKIKRLEPSKMGLNLFRHCADKHVLYQVQIPLCQKKPLS